MEDAIEAENQLCTTLFSKKQQANLKKIKGEGDDVKKELEGFSTDLLANLVTKTPKAEINGGRARRGWTKRSSRDKVRLVNRVPYIERLENNYSKQTKGKGIIKPALKSTVTGRKRRVR